MRRAWRDEHINLTCEQVSANLLEKMRDLIRHARHGGGDGDVGGEEVGRDLSGNRH